MPKKETKSSSNSSDWTHSSSKVYWITNFAEKVIQKIENDNIIILWVLLSSYLFDLRRKNERNTRNIPLPSSSATALSEFVPVGCSTKDQHWWKYVVRSRLASPMEPKPTFLFPSPRDTMSCIEGKLVDCVALRRRHPTGVNLLNERAFATLSNLARCDWNIWTITCEQAHSYSYAYILLRSAATGRLRLISLSIFESISSSRTIRSFLFECCSWTCFYYYLFFSGKKPVQGLTPRRKWMITANFQ